MSVHFRSNMSASSSWFSHSNLLSNISTSIVQATSKVTHAVQNLVQSDEQNNASKIFNDLSSTVMKSAQQLKQVVEEKSFLGHFTKEHDKFLTEKRTQQRREEVAVPPWIGYIEEEEMKQQILALSQVCCRTDFFHQIFTQFFFRKNRISFVVHRKALIIYST